VVERQNDVISRDGIDKLDRRSCGFDA